MKPTLLVLAAGMGSRYGGLKQLDPVGPDGSLIIDYSIYDALNAGFGKVVFVIRRDIEADFRKAIGDRIAKEVPVAYAFQELADVPAGIDVTQDRTKPWGTAHAVWAARDLIAEPFATINADDYYGPSSYRLVHDFLAAADPAASDYALVGYVLRNTLSDHGSVARGLCQLNDEGFLETVVEHTRISRHREGALSEQPGEAPVMLHGEEIVSMNMWGFTPTMFGHLERFLTAFLQDHGQTLKDEALIPPVVDALIQAGQARVRVLRSEERWYGVTYQEDRPTMIEGIRALIDAQRYPETLWA